jgi:hypothetical protein
MSSLTASCPFPRRALAALALPPLCSSRSGALAAIGPPPLVIATNQKLKGDGVSITYAFLPKDDTSRSSQATRRAQPAAQSRHKVMGRA